MTKTYDRAYFDKWYRQSEVGGNARLARKVALAVGFLCGEALEAALPILKQAGIPVITSSALTVEAISFSLNLSWIEVTLATLAFAAGVDATSFACAKAVVGESASAAAAARPTRGEKASLIIKGSNHMVMLLIRIEMLWPSKK